MTPEDCKKAIQIEYENSLKNGISHKNICILIKNRCQKAASHNGLSDYWRDYIPEKLRNDL